MIEITKQLAIILTVMLIAYSYSINYFINKKLSELHKKLEYYEKWFKIFKESNTFNFADFYENKVNETKIIINKIKQL